MDEAETGETGEDEEQTDDSEAVVEVEEAGKELSDDSDGGMDDDAMFRMDAYLAQIFKDRKNQAGGESAQSQLVLFKLRVLSLLEVYLHENPAEPEVLMVYLNLARAFVNPQTAEISEQFGQRIWGNSAKEDIKSKGLPKGCAKLEFRRVEALDLVIEILKSMVSSGNDESNRSASKKTLKNHLQKLSHLVKELATNMPEKSSRRAEVRRFCGKVFRYVSAYDLTKSFVKYLTPEAEAACESQLGELYLNFKKVER
ncbi:hypothetical protein OIU76_015116 [Salix suchowensis]|nr:hypothetical protein OIU76_015116 [Salix suchowensis]